MNQCIECNKAKGAIYRSNNRDKERKRNRLYGERRAHIVRSRVKRWSKNNKDRRRATGAKRRAIKRQAIPPWASLSEIQKHYAHAQALNTMLPDCRFEVDHIVPLKSDFVCGLHVENNLMVMEASQNASKSNRWWPGQLPCQQGKGASHEWWNDLINNMQ